MFKIEMQHDMPINVKPNNSLVIADRLFIVPCVNTEGDHGEFHRMIGIYTHLGAIAFGVSITPLEPFRFRPAFVPRKGSETVFDWSFTMCGLCIQLVRFV